MPVTDKQEFELYQGAVKMVFNPNSPRYRYVVTDAGVPDRMEESVRGVTSVLKDIIAKPDLMTWPMNMANQYLFGARFDEKLKKRIYDPSTAFIQPATPYEIEELQEALDNGSKAFTKRADKGKDVGTMVHEAIEAYLHVEQSPATEEIIEATRPTEPVEEDYDVKEQYESAVKSYEADMEQFEDNAKSVRKAYKAFVDWWESLDSAKVLSLEKPIYSRSLKYCGTFDLLAAINGKVYLLDIKTTNASKKAPLGIYTENFTQLGAYSYAFREETGERVDDVGIIRVGKDGKLHIATATDIGMDVDACERAFAFALRLHDWLGMATPFLADAHFRSHLLPSEEEVDSEDSKDKKEADVK